MIIVISILIVVIVILFLFFKFKNKTKKDINGLQISKVARLIQIFEQKTILNEESTYYELVKMYGKVSNETLVVTPFSKREVVYYQASATITFRKTEIVKDDKGFDQTKITTIEKTIFNQTEGNKLSFIDDSTTDYVIIESNSGGCTFDIPVCLEQEVSKDDFEKFNLNISLPVDAANAEILNYKIKETYLDNNSLVYVVGEARKSFGKVHICLSRNLKTPLIISNKDINL